MVRGKQLNARMQIFIMTSNLASKEVTQHIRIKGAFKRGVQVWAGWNG